MYEKYTEGARKTIFFARDEAVKRNEESIAPEHLLLGMLRAEPEMIQRLSQGQYSSVDDLKQQIKAVLSSESQSAGSKELPLSVESKNVLYAAHEASKAMHHRHIGVEHLLVGLLSEEQRFGRSTESGVKIRHFLSERGFARQVIEENIRSGGTSA